MPDDSDIDLTIKLGAFPMYVLAPINTAPAEIARSVLGILFIKKLGSPPAVLKNKISGCII